MLFFITALKFALGGRWEWEERIHARRRTEDTIEILSVGFQLLGVATTACATTVSGRQFDGLDALAVEANHLVVEEERDLPIPLAEADPTARVDAVPHCKSPLSRKTPSA